MDIASLQLLSNTLARSVVRMPPGRIAWHDDASDALGMANVQHRLITLRRDVEYLPRDMQAALLIHELCHCATRNEPEHHGLRWARLMRRCGVEPTRGDLVIRGGPLWAWLEAHRW
jgi:hypothetical protein